MKFTIAADTMLKEIKRVAPMCNKKLYNPAFACVELAIDCEATSLTTSALDGAVAIKSDVPVKDAQPGACLINPELLMPLLALNKRQTVLLETRDDETGSPLLLSVKPLYGDTAVDIPTVAGAGTQAQRSKFISSFLDQSVNAPYTVALSAEKMERLAKAFAGRKGKDAMAFRFDTSSATAPVVISTVDGQGSETRAVILPMKLEYYQTPD